MSAKTHFLFRSEKKIRERQRIAEGSGRRSDTMDQGMSGFCIKTSRGSRGNGGTKCGRWSPTEEQVKVLTDLFGSGLRTPSTDQIQNISSQLSFYGEIESKNVFYWFQNHKARERAKRRRTSVENPDLHEIKEKSSRARHFVEESETGMETLQLFPLNSYEECESEKMMRFFKNECEMMREMEYPPLDLRLSFF